MIAFCRGTRKTRAAFGGVVRHMQMSEECSFITQLVGREHHAIERPHVNKRIRFAGPHFEAAFNANHDESSAGFERQLAPAISMRGVIDGGDSRTIIWSRSKVSVSLSMHLQAPGRVIVG
jgi:hypothetical protein